MKRLAATACPCWERHHFQIASGVPDSGIHQGVRLHKNILKYAYWTTQDLRLEHVLDVEKYNKIRIHIYIYIYIYIRPPKPTVWNSVWTFQNCSKICSFRPPTISVWNSVGPPKTASRYLVRTPKKSAGTYFGFRKNALKDVRRTGIWGGPGLACAIPSTLFPHDTKQFGAEVP